MPDGNSGSGTSAARTAADTTSTDAAVNAYTIAFFILCSCLLSRLFAPMHCLPIDERAVPNTPYKTKPLVFDAPI
jgi:hypothetical protein